MPNPSQSPCGSLFYLRSKKSSVVSQYPMTKLSSAALTATRMSTPSSPTLILLISSLPHSSLSPARCPFHPRMASWSLQRPLSPERTLLHSSAAPTTQWPSDSSFCPLHSRLPRPNQSLLLRTSSHQSHPPSQGFHSRNYHTDHIWIEYD